MFEHLDDPDPYTPPAGLRTAVLGRVRSRRRRRAVVLGGVATVAAVGAGAVASLSEVRDRVTPDQVHVAGLPPADERPEPGEPVTVLLVGIDSHGDPALDEAEGRAGTLTDTIVVAHVDPKAGELRVLSVPRDLEVDGESGVRINSLLATGGPDALIAALRTQLDIEVDHYVEVDFAGFRRGVDTLGGLRISVPEAVRDDRSGLALAAGCQTIDGDQALALARSRRSVEVFQAHDGTWVPDLSGDFGRQDRAGVLAAALLRAVADVGPGDLPRLVRDGLDGIVVDDALDTDDLVALARQAGGAHVVPLRLPVVDVVRDRAQLLVLADGADAVVDRLYGDAPAAPAPGPTSPPVTGEPPLGDATGLAPC